MIRVGIIGVTGYAGEELVRILLEHPQIKITDLSAKIDKPAKIGEIFPAFKGKLDLVCGLADARQTADSCDLVFLALPHTISMDIVPELLASGKKVIDLSADYRLKDGAAYEKFYHIRHKDLAHLSASIYGLPELYRDKIKKADFIANPGCYPTAAILALAPLLKHKIINHETIIIDAKSGFSGAGREAVAKQADEIRSNFKAYKVNAHQHMPEINQELSAIYGKEIKVVFVPHILPLERGILETIYVQGTCLSAGRRAERGESLISLYKEFYKNEPFVRIKEEGVFPQLKDVVNTNFCDIGIKEEKDSIIIISAIDNLLKGASGQAVQNMNIIYGFPESTGLA
jgi:N-acetyl-gamma-glutamyl-phosphate reductase